ncbi:MAG: glycosyltransferase family 2 protein [Armatimonadota bacterium]
MDLSVSIVNWNTRDLLDQCLESVYASTGGLDAEVIVVDNASTDGSPDMVRAKYPDTTLIANSENRGFAAANNQALHLSRGRYFLLLNPDTICKPGALERLVRFLDENPKCGAVGPLVLNPDATLQYSWAAFPTFWSEALGRLDRRVRGAGRLPITAEDTRALGPFRADWVGGCCLMVRRQAIDEIGPMDESLFMYSEETDWCRRLANAGWEVWVEPAAEIVHLGGQSSARVPDEAASRLRQGKIKYFSKHHGPVTGSVLGAVLGLRSRARRVLIRRPERN